MCSEKFVCAPAAVRMGKSALSKLEYRYSVRQKTGGSCHQKSRQPDLVAAAKVPIVIGMRSYRATGYGFTDVAKVDLI